MNSYLLRAVIKVCLICTWVNFDVGTFPRLWHISVWAGGFVAIFWHNRKARDWGKIHPDKIRKFPGRMNWNMFVHSAVVVVLALIPKATYHWFTILGIDLNIFALETLNPAELREKTKSQINLVNWESPGENRWSTEINSLKQSWCIILFFLFIIDLCKYCCNYVFNMQKSTNLMVNYQVA